MKRIYFDHNATTPIAPEVLAAMMPYLTEEYGNASSIHSLFEAANPSEPTGVETTGIPEANASRSLTRTPEPLNTGQTNSA